MDGVKDDDVKVPIRQLYRIAPLDWFLRQMGVPRVPVGGYTRSTTMTPKSDTKVEMSLRNDAAFKRARRDARRAAEVKRVKATLRNG
jgi:hypothetical protein